MEIDEFVKGCLLGVLKGVRDAQSEAGGGGIAAKMRSGEPGGNLYDDGTGEISTRMDFDIAVTGETSGKGSAGVKVWGSGASGDVERRSGHESRICFSVPVRLPMGDRSLADQQNQESRDRASVRRAHRGRPNTGFV